VGERLYLHRHSLVHRLPAHVKIMAVLSFIIVSAVTPITQWQAFIAYFAAIFIVSLVAKIPTPTLLKRSLIEIPFILFAILMPFFGTGERFEVGPLNLYRESLLAAVGIVAKGTLGVLSAVVLSSSTTARELLRGLEKLHLPKLMVQIAAFMLRYVNVISDEMERMKVARESRGFIATGLKDWKVIAIAASALFIRSYERGERVHLAMLSRGYTGVLPHDMSEGASLKIWLQGLALPLFALFIFISTIVIG
jgi:cobalt/nickel transport system permease protein